MQKEEKEERRMQKEIEEEMILKYERKKFTNGGIKRKGNNLGERNMG